MIDAKYLSEIKARCEAFEKSNENYKVVQPALNDGCDEICSGHCPNCGSNMGESVNQNETD
jgi:hypothetical protein